MYLEGLYNTWLQSLCGLNFLIGLNIIDLSKETVGSALDLSRDIRSQREAGV